MPLKKLLVREHRNRVRARRFVSARDLHRIEICRDHPRRRRRLLHLRDQRQPLDRHVRPVPVPVQRLRKPAEILAQQRRRAQMFEPRQQLRDFVFFHGEDFLQAIGRHVEKVTSVE